MSSADLIRNYINAWYASKLLWMSFFWLPFHLTVHKFMFAPGVHFCYYVTYRTILVQNHTISMCGLQCKFKNKMCIFGMLQLIYVGHKRLSQYLLRFWDAALWEEHFEYKLNIFAFIFLGSTSHAILLTCLCMDSQSKQDGVFVYRRSC